MGSWWSLECAASLDVQGSSRWLSTVHDPTEIEIVIEIEIEQPAPRGAGSTSKLGSLYLFPPLPRAEIHARVGWRGFRPDSWCCHCHCNRCTMWRSKPAEKSPPPSPIATGTVEDGAGGGGPDSPRSPRSPRHSELEIAGEYEPLSAGYTRFVPVTTITQVHTRRQPRTHAHHHPPTPAPPPCCAPRAVASGQRDGRQRH